MRRHPFLLAVLTALALGPAAAPAVAAPAGGIQISTIAPGVQPQDIDGELDTAKALGAKIVRVEALWWAVEPTRGVYDPANRALMDHVMNGAAARGIKVLLMINSTPCWASSAPDSERGSCETSRKGETYPPTDPATIGPVSAMMAARYADKLAAFELWNEPDHSNENYFAGPDKVRRYVALLKVFNQAVKRAAPKVKVLAGSFVGGSGAWLEALYNAGMKGHYDAISVHFYDLVLASLRQIRKTQAKFGDKKPLWLAETGWTSCFPMQTFQDGHHCVTAGVQATSLRDLFAATRRASYLKAIVVYQLNDFSQYQFGVLDSRGARKPAFAALRAAFTRKLKPRKVKLSLKRVNGQVIATGSGPAADLYELDVFQGRTLRQRTIFKLDRHLRFAMALDQRLKGKLSVRVYQYWLGGGTLKSIRG